MNVITPPKRLSASPIGTDPSKAPDPDLDFSPIPKERYTSERFMQLEWERLWTKVWHVAGRERSIPDAGDYFTYDFGPESLLFVRQRDGGIRGFYNVCLHRGNQLRPGRQEGAADSFRCSYHHWEWHLDGSLKNIPDQETFPQLPPCEKLSLKEFKVDRWGGFIWFCLDSAGPSLRDYLGVIPGHLDCYEFDRMVCTNNVTIPWECNWKTSVDAFNETYHVQGIHPQIMPWHDDVNIQIDCYDRHSRFLAPFMAPSPRLSHEEMQKLDPVMRGVLQMLQLDPGEYENNAMAAREAMQQKKRAIQDHTHFPYKNLNDDQLTDDYHYTIFPNMQLNIFAESLMVFVSRPHPTDPNKMFWDLMNLTYVPEGEEKEDAPHQFTTQEEFQTPNPGTKEVLDQDAYNLPYVQRGMKSGAYDGLILGTQELRIAHFHNTLMRYIGEDCAN